MSIGTELFQGRHIILLNLKLYPDINVLLLAQFTSLDFYEGFSMHKPHFFTFEESLQISF